MKAPCLADVLVAALAAGMAQTSGALTCPPLEKFAEDVISVDDRWEWRLTFTPTGLRAYWSASEGWWPGTREQSVIHTSHWHWLDSWSTPKVAPFSGKYADMDPFVTPDGRALIFSSMRPVNGREKTDMDLWMVRRTWHGWNEPEHLDGGASIDGYDELYPSMDLHGNLYFARVKAPIPTEDVDIWRSRRNADGSYDIARRLGQGINTPDRWEYNPEVSPDGRTLLFARLDRPGDDKPDAGYGYGDLYVSGKHRRTWSTGLNLGPCVNTGADEFHPTVLWNLGLLFFARDSGGPSDFHRIWLRLPHP